MSDTLLASKAAAEYIGVSMPTLYVYRKKGIGPAYAKLTPGMRGPVRYRQSDLDAWIATKVRG